MKKTLTKLLAVAMTASVLLSACSSGTTTTENEGGESTNTGSEGATTEESGSETETETETASTGEEIKDLVIPKLATREIQTFDILYSQSFNDLENLTNLTDPLLEVDNKGQIVPGLADAGGTEDTGLHGTLHIREGQMRVTLN